MRFRLVSDLAHISDQCSHSRLNWELQLGQRTKMNRQNPWTSILKNSKHETRIASSRRLILDRILRAWRQDHKTHPNEIESHSISSSFFRSLFFAWAFFVKFCFSQLILIELMLLIIRSRSALFLSLVSFLLRRSTQNIFWQKALTRSTMSRRTIVWGFTLLDRHKCLNMHVTRF